jgi:hypothetical protein
MVYSVDYEVALEVLGQYMQPTRRKTMLVQLKTRGETRNEWQWTRIT